MGIFLRGLSANTKEETVRHIFDKFGEIAKVYFTKSRTYETIAAYVDYTTAEAAQAALAAHGEKRVEIDGLSVDVLPKISRSARLERSQAAMARQASREGGGGGGGFPRPGSGTFGARGGYEGRGGGRGGGRGRGERGAERDGERGSGDGGRGSRGGRGARGRGDGGGGRSGGRYSGGRGEGGAGVGAPPAPKPQA
jgi:hypothetical protein